MGGLSAARTVKSWKDEYGRTGIVGGMLVLALLIGFELVWYFFYCPVEDECQTKKYIVMCVAPFVAIAINYMVQFAVGLRES